MNSALVISIVCTSIVYVLDSITSGGSLAFLDVSVFITILVSPLPALAYTRSIKDFFTLLFSSKKKRQLLSYDQIQNSYESIKLVMNMILIAGVFISLISGIALMYNWDNKQFAGPNASSLLSSVCYASLFYCVLLPVKLQCKYALLSFMDEGRSPKSTESSKSANGFKIVSVIGISIIFIAVLFLYSFVFLKNSKSIPFPFNLPSIVLLCVSAIALAVSSGTFSSGGLGKAGEKSSYSVLCKKREFVSCLISCMVFSSIFISLRGILSILCNLEDSRALVPNTYVAFLPVFYALVAAALLLPVKTSLSKKISSMNQE
ncbi:MAG TPA: hypothetical protein PLV89_02640 [Treponemataceae bacterium]|nr:hypothetical protein [Treponemataceae bacterium]